MYCRVRAELLESFILSQAMEPNLMKNEAVASQACEDAWECNGALLPLSECIGKRVFLEYMSDALPFQNHHHSKQLVKKGFPKNLLQNDPNGLPFQQNLLWN